MGRISSLNDLIVYVLKTRLQKLTVQRGLVDAKFDIFRVAV